MAEISGWKDAVTDILSKWKTNDVVISPDLDGLLSLLALQEGTSKNIRVIAAYDGSSMECLTADLREKDLKEALWLDLDMQQKYLCLGQHIVDSTLRDNGQNILNLFLISHFN